MSTKRSLDDKVQRIFEELVGERAIILKPDIMVHEEILPLIQEVLREEYSEDVANEVAFHLIDWNSDAAFLIALMLFPEQFSKDEIMAGLIGFLVHVPNHVCGASTRAGYQCEDIFTQR